MASLLVCSIPDRVVQVQALARGHSIVFLGKTFNFDSPSIHPGVQMDTREFIAWVTLQWTSIKSRVE